MPFKQDDTKQWLGALGAVTANVKVIYENEEVSLDRGILELRELMAHNACSVSAIGTHLSLIALETFFYPRVRRPVSPKAILFAFSEIASPEPILKTIGETVDRGENIITFCAERSRLKECGLLRFVVDSDNVGFVRLAHLAILQMAADFEHGWGG
jgi:hypothetical protein